MLCRIGTQPLLTTGKRSLRNSSTSRHAPSITAASTPRLRAERAMFSPQKAVFTELGASIHHIPWLSEVDGLAGGGQIGGEGLDRHLRAHQADAFEQGPHV